MGKYLFGFIRERDKKTFGNTFISGEGKLVYTINFGEVAAVVSYSPPIEYMPSRKNMLEHQKVQLLIGNSYTVVPAAFGTVAESDKDIESLIKDNYHPLLDEFSRLTDKIELGLRIIWSENHFNTDIENEEIKRVKKLVEGKPENEVLKDKIILGKLVQGAIYEKREEYQNRIGKPLEKISSEFKYKETEKLPIKTVLVGYYLIDKNKLNEFDLAVEKLVEIYKDKLILNYTGPWPPYNFVNLILNIKR